MLRTSLISLAILAAPPTQAASLVASYVVERGDAARVKAAPGSAEARTAIDIVFGMGPAAAQGFVAASGRAGNGVMISRGPRTGAAALCAEPGVRLP